VPAIEQDGNVVIPVQKDERLFMNDDKECIHKFAEKMKTISEINKTRMTDERLVPVEKKRTITYGNLLKTKSWTQRPVDPEP
jgi:hypothetical protein